jgi:hypothetical protein
MHLRRSLDRRAAPPWPLAAIDLFGPDGVTLGSHLPIRHLSCVFTHLYPRRREVFPGRAMRVATVVRRQMI